MIHTQTQIVSYILFMENPLDVSLTMLKKKIQYDESQRQQEKHTLIQSGRKTQMPSSKSRVTQYKKEGPIIAIEKKIQYDQSQGRYANDNKKETKEKNEEDELFKEEKSLVESMWEDLGVTRKYIDVFEEAINNMSKLQRKQFLEQEKASLKRFLDNLLKLSKEKEKREQANTFLHNLDTMVSLSNHKDCFGNKVLQETVMSDIIQAIKAIRIHSVNVINCMNKIREICSYSMMNGKYNLDELNASYTFEKYYLVKIMYDLDFLKHSSLADYFEFSNESDPFLVNLSETKGDGDGDDIKKEKKKIVPIDEDMLELIKQCHYILMQDIFFHQIQVKDKEQKRNTFAMSQKYKIDQRIRNKNGNQLSQSLQKMKHNPDYDKLFIYKKSECTAFESGKKRIVIEREEIPVMSKQDLMKKIENYEKNTKDLIKNDGGSIKDDESDIKNDNDKNNNKKEDGEKGDKSDLDKEKEKEKHENGKRITEEEDEIKRKEQERLVELSKEKEKIERKKEQERQEALIKEKEEAEKREKERIEAIAKQQEKEEEEKRERLEALTKQKEEDSYKEEINDKEEEIQENINEKDQIIENNDHLNNSKHSKSKDSSLRKDKSTHSIANQIIEEDNKSNSQVIRENSKEDDNEKSEQQKQNEEETQQNKDQLNQYHVTFFNLSLQSIAELLSSSDYQSKIPQCLQDSFSASIKYSHKSFLSGKNPTILICSSKADNDLSTCIGVCQLSYGPSNQANSIKLNINHLSVKHQNWKYVIQSFIEFIINNFSFDELYLSINYKYLNDSYVINKDIMSFFKEQLKFKWSKIENISPNERLQEIVLFSSQKSISKKSSNPFNIQLSTIVSLSKLPLSLDNPIVYDKYINLFSVLVIVNNLKETSGYELTSLMDDKDSLLQIDINKLKTDLASIALFSEGGQSDIAEGLKNKYSEAYFNPRSSSGQYSALSIAISPSFKSSFSSVYNGYQYNRIEGKIGSIYNEATKQTMYLISTEDHMISLIILKVSKEYKEQFNQNSSNIYDAFYTSYPLFKPSKSEEVKSGVIWLPSFNINSHIISNGMSYFNDIAIKKEKEEHCINSIDEFIKVSYSLDNDAIKKSFEVKPDENNQDIIINESFILGIVNFNVLKKLNLPAILLLQINPDNWVKQ